jgi:RNA polymerase-binding transcription factor DksA
MAEDSETEETTDLDTDTETELATDEEVVLDLEAATEYEERIEELEETVETQADQIEHLEGLLLDLSTRVADGNDIGVCPECNGPVEKVKHWFQPTVIKCRRCDTVYHEY